MILCLNIEKMTCKQAISCYSTLHVYTRSLRFFEANVPSAFVIPGYRPTLLCFTGRQAHFIFATLMGACRGYKASSHLRGSLLSTTCVNPVTPLLRSSRALSIRNSGLPPYITHTVHSENKYEMTCEQAISYLLSSLFTQKCPQNAGFYYFDA